MIEFEDPPQEALKYLPPSTRERWAAMRENPGRWLVWSRQSTRANASNIRHRHPDLEVAWAHTEDGITIFTRLPLDSTDETA